MENSCIKVSVIMPVYNSGEYLKTAVESILNQSLREIELILVDDGSMDDSAEHCDEYARKDSRVRVIHQNNGGICGARNVGLEIARGEYIGFSDHDDEYGEGQLEDNYKLGLRNDVDIVKFGSRRIILNKGNCVDVKERKFWNATLTRKYVRENLLLLSRKEVLNGVWDGLFKRSFLIKNDIKLDTYYKNGGEDIDFCWQCAGKKCNICLNEKVYYNHYLRIDFSTSEKFCESSINVSLERLAKLIAHITELNVNLESKKNEYTYFWLRNVVGGICHCLSHPGCAFDNAKKIEILKQLTQNSFFRPWILKISPLSIRKIVGKQYVLLLWLYQHKLYRTCLNLYGLQYRIRRIK